MLETSYSVWRYVLVFSIWADMGLCGLTALEGGMLGQCVTGAM